MKTFYKIVRRHPITHQLVDTYSGSVAYAVGETVEDHTPHGLSVHTTATRAMVHGVPATSVGRDWTAVLLRVSVAAEDVVSLGNGARKTLVRRLTVTAVERDQIHPDVAQQNLSPYRLADAEGWLKAGWGGFREVGAITRGSPSPAAIPAERRQDYVIECRPASSGGWGKSVAYRAVRRG